MERIFYNNKLKKLISAIILVMLLLNLMVPYGVFGTSNNNDDEIAEALANNINLLMEDQFDDYYWTKDDALNFIENFLAGGTNRKIGVGDNIEIEIWDPNNDSYKNVNSKKVWILINDRMALKSFFEEFLEERFGINSTDASSAASLFAGIQNDGCDFYVFNTDSETEFIEETGGDVGSIDEETQIKEKIRQWIKDNTTYDEENAFTEEGWATLLNWIYACENGCYFGRDSEGNVTNVVISDAALSDLSEMDGMLNSGVQSTEDGEVPDGTAGADLGGILLSPVFYLINFIADAITSNLGRIMTGDSLSLISGFKVLTDEKNDIAVSSSEPYQVNTESFLFDEYQYPNIQYTPEEIFAGKIDLLSIDFISGKNFEGNTNSNEGWNAIRYTISQWYKVLRMVAIIGLLSVLIYTGIKIMISANAKDKAKYKEWIINWFVAVAILFFMHYIMSFIISVINEINKLLSSTCSGINVQLSNGDSFVTNLMGLVRFMIQSEDFYIKVGFEVMYIALIVYTVKFTFIYLKRVLNMAFLTLIAPIVALTYPIDKLNDGQAQGFNMWLKEYMFNAILQPMHLIMYYILVGSAIGIASENPIYGIVVLAFMNEAEKLLKKIFGFDKAGVSTVGGMAGAFAAGALASNVKNIARMAKLPSGNGNKNGSGGAEKNNLLDNVKPLKDGSVEDNFSDNLLDDGNEQTNNSQAERTSSENNNNNRTNQDSNDENRTAAEEYAQTLTNAGIVDPEERRRLMEESGYEPDYGQDSEQAQRGEQEGTEQSNVAPASDNGEPINKKAERKAKRKEFAKNHPGLAGVGRGVRNVGKTIARPVVDIDRLGTGYNAQRWKRRGVKALKGAGRLAVGATLGTAAAAIQAGISITDGKYSPMEGMATFAAGYAGGGKLTQAVGGKVSNLANTFKEGYYEGDNQALIEKQKKEFMYSDEKFKQYKQKYGDEAKDMQELARDYMVPYGYTDTKDQFAIQKMANHLVGDNNKGNKALMEKAIKQSRATKGFIKELEQQGQLGAIRDLDKQEKYIQSVIKSKNYNENSDEAKQLRQSYGNAFKSAAVWQDVNK